MQPALQAVPLMRRMYSRLSSNGQTLTCIPPRIRRLEQEPVDGKWLIRVQHQLADVLPNLVGW